MERLLQKTLAFEDPVYINGKRSLFLVSIQLQPRTWPALAGYFLLLPEVSGDHSVSLGKIKRQIKELQPLKKKKPKKEKSKNNRKLNRKFP